LATKRKLVKHGEGTLLFNKPCYSDMVSGVGEVEGNTSASHWCIGTNRFQINYRKM
jgi:hypothetical protein